MKTYKILLPLLAAFILSSCERDHRLIRLRAYQIRVDEMFEKTRDMAAGRDSILFGVLDSGLNAEEKDAFRFLLAFAPLSDLADYDGSYFLSQARMSLKARKEMPWGMDIPEEIFLHFVLPVRVNNENLDTFRNTYYDELKARLDGMSMYDAALEVNHWCHEKVTYRGSDERTSSPLASIRTSWGRCGEESTFTVAAMRAVGIPARQVYTPRWAHSDDNHAWVEVWVDGRWYFLGACEPDARLNQGWFAEPAKRTMLVHTRAYGWYRGTEPRINEGERFAELNLIANYAPVKKLEISLTDSNGRAVKGARVEFQLYNYAEFFPIARATTDNSGIARITCGKGDLLVWAGLEKLYGFKFVRAEEDGRIGIRIGRQGNTPLSMQIDLVPPAKAPVTANDTIGRAQNQIRLRSEDSIRNAYMRTFPDSAFASSLARETGFPYDTVVMLIRKSQGNWKAVSAFMRMPGPEMKPWVLKMLLAFTDKDLRDGDAGTWHEHLVYGMKVAEELRNIDPSFFAKYVLSPRIGNEMIRPWRKQFFRHFDRQFFHAVRHNPEGLAKWITENIVLNTTDNLHSRAPLSPAGVAALKVADARSRDIFFVALCRTAGQPARLNPATGIPQVFSYGDWHNISFGKQEAKRSGKSRIRFINVTKDKDPQYYVHFTIARLQDGFYRTYDLGEGLNLSRFPEYTEVESGDYMLVTGNRMQDGGVLASINTFIAEAGKVAEVKIDIRQPDIKAVVYGHADLEEAVIREIRDGMLSPEQKIDPGKGTILVFIEPEKETSRHVLADIPSFKKELEEWGGNLIFIPADEKAVRNTDPAMYAGLPKQSIFAADPGMRIFKMLQDILKKELDKLPVVAVINPESELVYFSEGYTIGIGEQLVRLIRK